ncbi:hypothetical protein DESC_150023 [Desulfosarcina cetonica]|nr:hypothetical protein DESC_150023 [Desulfosarcina cetonica]
MDTPSALAVFHVRVDDCSWSSCVGVAENVIIGGGGLTVIVADEVTVPSGPVAVIV